MSECGPRVYQLRTAQAIRADYEDDIGNFGV